MAEQQLDIIIKTILEGDGLKATSEQLAQVREEIAKLPAEDQRREILKGVVEGMAAEVAELKKLLPAEKEAEEQTKKSTTAKTALHDALKGLATEFPALAQVVRTVVSPLGAVAAAAVLVVRGIRDMSAQRDGIRALALEYEQLQQRTESLAEIQGRIAKMRKSVVKDYNEMSSAVNKFAEALDEQQRTALANQAITEKIDDQQLRSKLLDIEAGTAPESEKNLQRSRAMQDARGRKEQHGIDDIAAGASRDFVNAEAARTLQKELEAKMARLDPSLASAKDAVDTQGRAQEATTAFVEEQRKKNKEKMLFARGEMGDGPINMVTHPEMAAKHLTEFGLKTSFPDVLKELEQRDADLADTLKEEAKATEQVKEALAALTKERDALKRQAEEAKNKGDTLDQSARMKRVDFNNAMEGRRRVDPLINANDQRENDLHLREQATRESVEMRHKLQSMHQADQSGEPQKFVQAVTKATGVMADTVDEAVALMKAFEERSLRQKQEIEDLRSRERVYPGF